MFLTLVFCLLTPVACRLSLICRRVPDLDQRRLDIGQHGLVGQGEGRGLGLRVACDGQDARHLFRLALDGRDAVAAPS